MRTLHNFIASIVIALVISVLLVVVAHRLGLCQLTAQCFFPLWGITTAVLWVGATLRDDIETD